MRKVLITGTSGYVARSFETWVLEQHQGELAIEYISLRGDEWKKKNWENYDTVVHAAGVVHRNEKKTGYEVYERINHLLSVEVAEKAKKDGVKHFIFLSTKGVYKPNTGYIDINTKPNPQRFYGKSKLAAENDIIPLQADTFRVSILRPPTIYGEQCKGNFKNLEKLSKKIHIFPDINNDRSMIYIWNFCEFLYLLIIDPVEDTILFPQNKEYSGTEKLLVLLWKERHENYRLSRILATLVNILIKGLKIGKLKTMFMDSKYDQNMSDYYKGAYRVYSLEDSIKQIVKRSRGYNG